MPTRTGNFTIGFRRGGGAWTHDLASLAKWARASHFESIDLNKATVDDISLLKSNGLRLGSVDVLDMVKLISSNEAERHAAVEANVKYVKEIAAAGAHAFFAVVFGDAARKRAVNYAIAVESFKPIAEACAAAKVHLVLEGWPGSAPAYPNLCCTPETIRMFIDDVNPDSVGLNYDPSHLIRLGVDHILFLREFAGHVKHVHAKDTQLMPEAAYEFGIFQPSVRQQAHGFGELAWRYTIPGHGITRWPDALEILAEHKFTGVVSVELEDEHFNGSEAGEKAGFLHSLAFLQGA